jgi:hypothetical protein
VIFRNQLDVHEKMSVAPTLPSDCGSHRTEVTIRLPLDSSTCLLVNNLAFSQRNQVFRIAHSRFKSRIGSNGTKSQIVVVTTPMCCPIQRVGSFLGRNLENHCKLLGLYRFRVSRTPQIDGSERANVTALLDICRPIHWNLSPLMLGSQNPQRWIECLTPQNDGSGHVLLFTGRYFSLGKIPLKPSKVSHAI